jgi:hypothetical protein
MPTRLHRMNALALAATLALPACFSATSAEDPLAGPVQEAGVYATTRDDRGVRVSVLLTGRLADVEPWFQQPELLEKWLADEVTVTRDDAADVERVTLRWPAEDVEIRGTRVIHDPASPLAKAMDLEIEPLPDITADRLRVWGREEAGGTRVFLEQWPFTGGMAGERAADGRRRMWFDALRVLRAAYERGLPTTPIRPPPTLATPEPPAPPASR